MDSAVNIEICYKALMLVFWLSLPAVLTSAVVGLIAAMVQTVTQIQDQGIPQALKFIAVFAVLALTSKWIATELYHTADQLFVSVGLRGADAQ